MPSRSHLFPLVLGALAAAQEMATDMGTSSSGMKMPTAGPSSVGETVASGPGGSSSSASDAASGTTTTTTTTMVSVPPLTAAFAVAVPLGTGGAAVSWSYFNTTVTTVQVVAAVSTVCAAPTTYTFNGCEYPVTAGQTLVVTDCPCTVTTTMPMMTSTPCPVATPAAAVPPANANASAGEAPPPRPAAATPTTGGVYGAPTAPMATPSAAVQMAAAGAPPAVAGDGSLLGLAAALGAAAALMRAV